MRNLMLSVALVSSSLLTACGGGLGGDVQAISQVAITSNPAFDGYLRNDGTDFDGLPVAVVGDSAANQYWRGYFRFSLASIPAGAQVTGARLRLTRIASVGAPLGTREIEHVNLGGAVNGADFNSVPISVHGGTLLPAPLPNVWEVDVTGAVQENVFNADANSDFRLRFALNILFNGAPDFESWGTADHPNADLRPELVITYIEP